ncbi:hypothetical protein [uncultured Mediterranean phage]|nr:hypothetical protein [uncultured Mediterranean phage]
MNSFVTEHFNLIRHYVCNNKCEKAYYHYSLIKNEFENDYESVKNILGAKISAFLLPYYVIIASEKARKYKKGIRMYEIIFKKRFFNIDVFYINCLLHNSAFFVDKVKDKRFFGRFTDYIDFLKEKNVSLDKNTLKGVRANIRKYRIQKEGGWVFYCTNHFEIRMVEQYIKNLNALYDNIVITNCIRALRELNPRKITFVHEIYGNDKHLLKEFAHLKLGFLNTEPLNNSERLKAIATIFKKYTFLEYYDYSSENIQIMKKTGTYLPYICSKEELNFLKKINKETIKKYDYGIIVSSGGRLEARREKVVALLKERNYSVNIIKGWGEDRDHELAKCKIILNIHGEFCGQVTSIFEHIRCDRLLESGFNILSEEIITFDNDFFNKYPNLTIIKYDDFFQIPFKRRVVDCFTFYNELELLKYRLTILDDCVDFFVLAEATLTHAGKEKKLYYGENKEMFKEFNHKIIHVVVNDFPHKYPNINYDKKQQWKNENFQRACLDRGIKKLSLHDDDIIVLADVDEIPNPSVLKEIKKENMESLELSMDFYYYNLNCKMKNKWEMGANVFGYKTFKEFPNAHAARLSPPVRRISKGGWHLSYFGNEEFIRNKIQNFAHQEYNKEQFINDEHIKKCIENAADVFGRPNDKMIYTKLEDNDFLPPHYEMLDFKRNADKKIYIYIHICCKGAWLEIFTRLIDNIKQSGLYEVINQIKCFMLGDPGDLPPIFDDAKITIVKHNRDTSLYERFTLNNLYDDCEKEDFYVLYLHTKGITHPGCKRVRDWVDYLIYFNMYKFKEIIDFLKIYDTVGVNLQPAPEIHYSGNFWWSKSAHIKTLNRNIGNHPNDPEFWITSKKEERKYISLWLSKVNHYKKRYPKENYVSKGISIYTIESKRNIAFWDNQLCERGTTTSLFDYAYYNEKLLGNKSYIFYEKNNPENKCKIIEKFKKHFVVHGTDDFKEVDEYLVKYNISHIYIIKYGKLDTRISKVAKNCINCVFDCNEPHGEVYSSIAPWVKGNDNKYPVVPHMINLPKHNRNMRNKLNIPRDAIVFGGYGGRRQFDIQFVQKVVYNMAKKYSHIYFLFANFNKFCADLPNIIHLPMITDLGEKVEFINTCDAMLWGRSDGETYGLAIAEFSTLNKPIICKDIGSDRGHVHLLKDKAIWYNDEKDLTDILLNFNPEIESKKDWNAYKDYTPEKVMKIFDNVFLHL